MVLSSTVFSQSSSKSMDAKTVNFLYEKADNASSTAGLGLGLNLAGLGISIFGARSGSAVTTAGFLLMHTGAIVSSMSASDLVKAEAEAGTGYNDYDAWGNYKTSWVWFGVGTGMIVGGVMIGEEAPLVVGVVGGLVCYVVSEIYLIAAAVGPYSYASDQADSYEYKKSKISMNLLPTYDYETNDLGANFNLAYNF